METPVGGNAGGRFLWGMANSGWRSMNQSRWSDFRGKFDDPSAIGYVFDLKNRFH